MKLKIEGTEYDLGAALEKPTLFLVREMKIRTGYGMKSLMDAAKNFNGKTGEDILDDPDLVGALIAMIWLARRQAVEKLSFEEAGSFDISQMEYISDPAPEPAPVADVPKAPETVSVPDAAPPVASAAMEPSIT